MQDDQDPDNPYGEKLIPTGDMADQLGISRGTLILWHHQGYVRPAWTTRGGHFRWAPRWTREQLADRPVGDG